MDGAIGVHGLEAPDYTVPIIGFRKWYLRGTTLYSPHIHDHVWTTEQKARCLRFDGERKLDHPSPDPTCGCGYYAYLNIDLERVDLGHSQVGSIAGAVAALGRIVVHEGGWRAERIRIVAIAKAAAPTDPGTFGLPTAAAKLGVPLVPFEDLPGIAAEYGEPVPEDVLERVRERNRAAERERIERRQRQMAQQARLRADAKTVPSFTRAVARGVKKRLQ